MAARVPDMFCSFYIAKNHKIAINLTTTKGREKMSKDLESLKFLKFFGVGLPNFKNNQILLRKISRLFLATIKRDILIIIFI